MKLNKLFMLGLAGLAFAACSNDEEVAGEVQNNETVSFRVANITTSIDSRALDTNGFTDDSQAKINVAELTDLNVLFADANGNVVLSRKFADATEDNGTYTFHQLPSTVTAVGITDVVAPYTTLAAAKDARKAVADQQSDLESVLVYGESLKLQEIGTEQHGALTFKHYDAGTIIVQPLLARIEIGNIECMDLNSAVVGDNGLLPAYSELTLGAIGIHNTLATVDGTLINYLQEAEWTAANGWNKDVISDVILNTTADDNKIHAGVYVYNVAAGNVPNIILQIDEYEWNTNLPTDQQPTEKVAPLYVKSNGLADITTFEAGHIYQVNYKFNCENVHGWNGEDDVFICVDVKVVIPTWTIHNNLTPTFE